MQVSNIDIDLYNFKCYYEFDKTDIQVLAEYINSRSFVIHVRRLDSPNGWNDNIQVLVCYLEHNYETIIYEIGSSLISEKKIIIKIIDRA